jgi:hypothetical protein
MIFVLSMNSLDLNLARVNTFAFQCRMLATYYFACSQLWGPVPSLRRFQISCFPSENASEAMSLDLTCS